MKLKKLFAGIIAAVSTVTILTVSISAYDFEDKNLGKNWSINAVVPASEFAELTEDSYVTVTFEADQDEEEYWSIKPMDSSWVFIDPNGEGGPELAEGKDAYPVEKDATSISFKIPTDYIESIKENGMVFIGHSITLKTLTVSNEPPAAETAPEETGTAENNTDNNIKDSNEKDMPNTGVEGAAVFAAVGIAAIGAVLAANKKK